MSDQTHETDQAVNALVELTLPELNKILAPSKDELVHAYDAVNEIACSASAGNIVSHMVSHFGYKNFCLAHFYSYLVVHAKPHNNKRICDLADQYSMVDPSKWDKSTDDECHQIKVLALATMARISSMRFIELDSEQAEPLFRAMADHESKQSDSNKAHLN